MMGKPEWDEPRMYNQTETCVLMAVAQFPQRWQMAAKYAHEGYGVPYDVFDRVTERMVKEGLLCRDDIPTAGIAGRERIYWNIQRGRQSEEEHARERARTRH